MGGAFAWLNAVFEYFWRLIPDLRIIPSTHAGVAFVRGKPRAIAPGRLYFYWPMWTQVVVVPVVRQTLNLPSQVIMTSRPDGAGPDSDRPLCVSAIVVYEITGILKALTRVHDLDEAISDLSLAMVKRTLCGQTYEEIYRDREQIDRAIRKELARKLADFGVKVHNVFLSDISTCRVFKVLGDTRAGYLPAQEDKEE